MELTRPQMKEIARLTALELYKLMSREPKPQAPADGYLTMREAAAYIGRSYSYLQHHTDIPRVKHGGRYMYTRAALSEYIETH